MLDVLTHWGRVTHICASKLTIIGSDNGLSPGRHQAIVWTNAGILLIGHLGTNFSEILIENSNIFIQENAFENGIWKMQPYCLGEPQCVNGGLVIHKEWITHPRQMPSKDVHQLFVVRVNTRGMSGQMCSLKNENLGPFSIYGWIRSQPIICQFICFASFGWNLAHTQIENRLRL